MEDKQEKFVIHMPPQPLKEYQEDMEAVKKIWKEEWEKKNPRSLNDPSS